MFRNLLLGGDWKVTVWTGGRLIRGTKVRLGPGVFLSSQKGRGDGRLGKRLLVPHNSRSLLLTPKLTPGLEKTLHPPA